MREGLGAGIEAAGDVRQSREKNPEKDQISRLPPMLCAAASQKIFQDSSLGEIDGRTANSYTV